MLSVIPSKHHSVYGGINEGMSNSLKYTELYKGTEKTFFFREDIQMANKFMKSNLTSVIVSEVQIKTRVRFYLISLTMVIIKKNNKCW